MTRIMFDATHELVLNIPTDAQMVAGYLPPSGHAWTAADWGRFPNAVHVRIAVRASTNDGHVLDVESGDATPQQAPGWVVMRRAAGADPTVYCSTSLWPSVRAAFQAANVTEPHYWVASYPGGGAVIPAGAVAHQYMDAGIYDKSVVADYWPGVDGGIMPVLDSTDLANVGQAVTTALINFRVAGPDGAARNLWDSAYQERADDLAAAKTLTADQSALLAAIHTGVDVPTLAAALAPVLAPLLPVDATPAQVGEAVVAALESHLAATPPAAP